jgi:hypothetical protein
MRGVHPKTCAGPGICIHCDAIDDRVAYLPLNAPRFATHLAETCPAINPDGVRDIVPASQAHRVTCATCIATLGGAA